MKMLDHALAYAEKGYAVFPVHEPVFKDGKLIGCTCEAYKRSDKYRQFLDERGRGKEFNPQYKCENPGKCPRVKWGEKSTTNADTIRQWWHWWPTSNIGIDCGKSGLLVFDLDSYKDFVGDVDDLLSKADRETVTALTGGGGEHLWYKLGDKTYGNSTKGLPVGVDIRGIGGYVVAPPSLHKSGKRYGFEDGYSPEDGNLLDIPMSLDAILSASHRTTRPHGEQITPDAVSVQRAMRLADRVFDLLNLAPTADGWGEGIKYILETCPFNPTDNPHAEDRSAFVCIAADGAISAGCHHNRCHHVIEDSGLSGWHLLKQLAGIDPNEGKQPNAFGQLLAQARHFVKTTSFADFIPADLQSKVGYRTDGTDTKLADALLDLAELANNFTVYASYETLRDLAGLGSKSTVKAALERLFGWFISRNETAPAHDQAFTYSINVQWIVQFVARRSNAIDIEKDICVRSTRDKLTYTERKATDPFLSGRSRTAKREGLTEAGLGEGALRLLDVLSDGQGWTRAELADETGKKASGIGRLTLRLEKLGLIYSEQEAPRAPKIYYLEPGAGEKVTALAHTLKTHHLRAERKERVLEAEQTRVDTQMSMADKPGTVARLAQKRSNIIDLRRRVLAVIHPDWTAEQILEWLLSEKPNQRPWVDAKQRRQAADQKAAANKLDYAHLEATAADLKRQGISGSQAYAMAAAAEYTKREAAIIASMTKGGGACQDMGTTV